VKERAFWALVAKTIWSRWGVRWWTRTYACPWIGTNYRPQICLFRRTRRWDIVVWER
jgi:hypothetical protein